MTGEQKMALAAVVLAVRDVAAFAAGRKQDTANGENFTECWSWINRVSEPEDYAFDTVCETVGIEPNYLRKRMFEVLAHPEQAEPLLADLYRVRNTAVSQRHKGSLVPMPPRYLVTFRDDSAPRLNSQGIYEGTTEEEAVASAEMTAKLWPRHIEKIEKLEDAA